MFNSVRARLTIWYVSALAVVLIGFSVAAYFLLARSLYDRLDARLASSLQAAASALKHVPGDRGARTDEMKGALGELRFPNQTVAVLDDEQQIIIQKTGPGGPPFCPSPAPLKVSDSIAFYEIPESDTDDSESESAADDGCRAAFQSVSGAKAAGSYTLVVVESLEPTIDQLELLENFLYLIVPLTLLLAGLGGWLLARRSLAPVVAMSDRAQRMSMENLEQRLPVVNPRDELGHLATTFNELLARLSRSFAQQRQFMTDASHELRTPLSAIRTASAVTLQREERQSGEYREALAVIEQEARRLTRIVEDMFLLARADAGHPVLQVTKFYLDELLAESARAANVLASEKQIQFETSAMPEAPFSGDEALLRQMLWNLLDNAIKHTPPGGKVGITLKARDAEYEIGVTDTGSGITRDAKPHIFERFYRADPARAREEAPNDGGAGLGLPIARWIAEAHHGRIELSHSDTNGSTFVVTLPRT